MLSAPSGCTPAAQTQAKGNGAGSVRQAGGETVRCRREYPTGSHISQMVCYRVRHIEDRRTSDQEKMRNMQIGGALVPPTAPSSQ